MNGTVSVRHIPASDIAYRSTQLSEILGQLAEPVPVPVQDSVPVYDGAMITPTWANLVPEHVTLSGTLSAVNAGIYEVTATLGPLGKWEDGTTDPKTIEWRIDKARGTLTLAGTTTPSAWGVGVGYMNYGAYHTIQCNTSGTITATVADSAIATARIRTDGTVGLRLSVIPVKKGTTAITISVSDDPNYITPSPVTVSVTSNIPSSDLAECTWDEIKSAVNAGVATKLWQVGDLSPFIPFQGTMAGVEWDEEFNWRIVHMNNSEIYFQVAQNRNGVEIALYKEGATLYMNPTDTNAGGYEGSHMRNTTMPECEACLPEELRRNLSLTPVWTDNMGNSGEDPSAITCTHEKVWLEDQQEVFRKNWCINPHITNKVSQFQWHEAGNRPVAHSSSNPLLPLPNWLRTPCAINSAFQNVIDNGGLGYWSPFSLNRGIRPIIRIAAA